MKRALVTNKMKNIVSPIALLLFSLMQTVSAESEYTKSFNSLLWLEVILSVAVLLLVGGLMAFMLVKFRDDGTKTERPTIKNELKFEITWTVLTLVIVLFLFFASIAPAQQYINHPETGNEETINIVGYQFYWTFEFENHSRFVSDVRLNDAPANDGRNYTADYTPTTVRNSNNKLTYNVLSLKVGVTYKLNITGSVNSVIHSFFVPDLSIKVDAVPGSSNILFLKITKAGTYWGACAELCGAGHYNMLFAISARG